MAGMLSIGITGLNAAQTALSTTSHNIANASVEGYSRQSIVQGAQIALFTGSGFIGQGTQVDTIRRSYSQYLESQVLSSDTQRAALQAYDDKITQIDNLLADSSVGLSSALESFFDGVQEVAANPSDVAARQSMISSAQALASRFQALDERLSEIRDGVESDISSTVESINTYAEEIALINQRIVAVESAGSSSQANDLRDSRDTLIRELNQLVNTNTVEQSDGTLAVFIGSGQPLVIGATANSLTATASSDDPTRLAIGLALPNGASVTMPEDLLTGGALGGLLEFRSGALDTAQDQLGLIAVGVVEAFNAQHRLGQDLNGDLGLDFFVPLSPSVRGVDGATGTPTVEFGDIANLTGGDYTLTYTDTSGGYTLVDNSTGSSVLAADVGLTITPPGTTVVGESFVIEPTRYAAQDITVAITNTSLVAAGSPVRVVEDAGNLGSAAVTGVTVTSTAAMASSDPHIGDYSLVFDSGSNTYQVYDSTSTLVGSIAYNPSSDSAGVTRTLPSPLDGIDITLNGVPSDGDSFTLESNTDGVSDSTNAVALGALQTTKTMLSSGSEPTANFQTVYANLVSEIGNMAASSSVNLATQETLVEQATAARESLSGVNLDEEAANLIRYQQAYQASARVMEIASSLFDEILAITR